MWDVVDNAAWCALGFSTGYFTHWARDVLIDMRRDVSKVLARTDQLEGKSEPDDDHP